MNQTEFANFIGMPKPTITKWVKKGWVSKREDGTIDLGSTIAYLRDYRAGGLSDLTPSHAMGSGELLDDLDPDDVEGYLNQLTDGEHIELARQCLALGEFYKLGKSIDTQTLETLSTVLVMNRMGVRVAYPRVV